MKIKPRKSYVLVRPDSDDPRESEYGILTPSNVEQEKKAIGTVVSCGSDVKDLSRGEKVIYGVYSGDDVKISDNGKELSFKIIISDEILATIEQ